MTLEVLYFAVVRDRVGRDSERLQPPESVRTVAELASWLATRHPPLASALPHVRFARNLAFASGDERLADGDVVAIMPPVAGG